MIVETGGARPLAEQTAKATGEIGQAPLRPRWKSGRGDARNLAQRAAAAAGTQMVSANITDVRRGATETETASSHVLSAAQLLSGDSNRLKVEVAKFLEAVRAA